VPLAPQPGVYVVFAEAIYRLYQLALERLPAHLTVRDHRKPCPLLQPDSPVYGPILDAFELGCGDPACRVAFARLQQFWRSQETADDICPGENGVLHRGQSSTRSSRSLSLRELYRSSIDEQYDLATYVPDLPFFERLRCFLEREGAI
jgi:hypothetical protein